MAWILTLLLGCYDPTVGTLPDNVGQAFAPCQESEIRFLATKHNFQLSFEPCGNNNFVAYSWSPDGANLYFQLGTTGYVMNAAAENKQTLTVPTPSPIGMADWVTSRRLALPVGPEEAGGKNRIAVYDLDQKSVFYRELDVPGVDRVLASGDPSQLLIVTGPPQEAKVTDDAEAARVPKKILRMDLADGSTKPAFPWLDSFDTIDVAPVPQRVIVGKGEKVTVHDLEGKALTSFEPATRGTLHPEGRWLALEHEGDEQSIFYQRAWDDMTEQQRRRERQRAEKLAASLPDSYPTTVRPPMISLVDLQDDARFVLTSVHGSEFQWYEAVPYHASFIFWGFEGKQFKRNVLLGQMGSRLRATELGREFMGVEPMNEVAKSRGSKAVDAEEPDNGGSEDAQPAQ